MRPMQPSPSFLLASFVSVGVALGLACSEDTRDSMPTDVEGLRVENLVTGLDTPWDLAWGPDGQVWVTERGGRISRVNASTGQRTTAGQVPSVEESGESGLLGLAFHPDFATQPYVYVAHSYLSSGSVRNRLVRMRWDGQALGAPEVLLANIPGGGIHDGSRLAIGPDKLLYMTTGDAASADLAQDRNSLAGKVLRLTLTGQPAPGNPFNSAIYSYGHRNPQGLVFHPTTGALYATEHGPGDNDEVNLIAASRNFGWPTVHGTCDDDIGAERVFCQANNVVEPLAMWTPTIAPAGADIFLSDLIPQSKGSLLFASHKERGAVSAHAVRRWSARHRHRDSFRRPVRSPARCARRPRRGRVSRYEQPRWPR